LSCPVRLPPGSHRLEIEYTALTYGAPDKTRFQTRLEGIGRDWEDAEDLRVARFYELQPGDYVFRVRAANHDGVWNEAGASLAFTVQPFFWQTTGFRIALALVLVGTGAAAVSWRIRARLRRALEREQAADAIRDLAGRLITAQEAERSRLARDLHDGLSQSLALLSVELEMFGRQPPATPGAVDARMRELSAGVKDLSAEVHRLSHELHPAKLEQLGLVAALRGFCKELSTAHGLPIHFEPGDVPRHLPDDVALCLYRLAQEALQNVLKHSGATSARVELATHGDEIFLRVADDGRGFDVSAVRTPGSLGLVGMQERMRLVHGRVTVESQSGQGTQIEARVPAGPPSRSSVGTGSPKHTPRPGP